MNFTVNELLQRLGYRDLEVQSLRISLSEKDKEIENLKNTISLLQSKVDEKIKNDLGIDHNVKEAKNE
jgi:hypothetical protein